MALKNSQYYAIMREYEKIRQKNHDIQTARYEEVYTKLPEFKSLDESISILSVQYGKKLLNGDKSALSSLKEELEILRSSKSSCLSPQDFRRIILNRSMTARTAKTPDTSGIRNVTALSRPSYNCYMTSRILRSSRPRHLSNISDLIFIPLHFMIKQPGEVPVL